MKICDIDKLHKMVDEFCVENRPKSIDIHRMINECTIEKSFLKPKDHAEHIEENDAIKLKMACGTFSYIMDEMRTVSLKTFIEYYMYLCDLTEEQLLRD